jgi:hypothetical protein
MPKHLILVFFFGIMGGSHAVFGAPITFNTALPVAKGEFVFRQQFIVSQSGDDPSGADRDRTSQAAVSVLGYGVNRKLAVFGVMPYLSNELKITAGSQRISRNTNGFGDLSVFGRYTAYQRDQPGRTFRVAPFFGVKTPTGENDASDTFGRLPPSIQVGSGSWDSFVGVVATYQTLDYQLDGQFEYRANNEANNFEAADTVRLDGSLQYRVHPRKLTGGVPAFLYIVIEANLIRRDRDRVGGMTDPNSDGTTLFVAPGIQYITMRWIIEGAVQIPVTQNLNGTALENDYVARAGFRFNF